MGKAPALGVKLGKEEDRGVCKHALGSSGSGSDGMFSAGRRI